jgi:hypothetical protein
MSYNICPRFASCITPCVYGRTNYFFVKEVCMTEKHLSCVHFMGLERGVEPRITVLDARAAGEQTERCSRYDICQKKAPYGLGNVAMAPIPEYEALVCKQRAHLKCLFYFTWFMSGRWPDDDMTSLEIKDGPSFKEAAIDRLKGETDGFLPRN